MVDAVALMGALSVKRPVFGSEADFQLALAWQIQQEHPSARVRLEYRPAYLDRRGYLDLWAVVDGWEVAIELKYFTRALVWTDEDEQFELLNQSAHDVSRYDFIRDIERVESVVLRGAQRRGYVIALTNDSLYWRVPTILRPTADAAFRLHEGTTFKGTMAWGAMAGAGTTRGRQKPHTLHSAYSVTWHDYSRVSDAPGGQFRYALVELDAGRANEGAQC